MAEVIEYYPTSLRAQYHRDALVTAQKSVVGIASADIGWVPDADKYEKRSKARQAADVLATTLPKGWPKVLHGPLVWNAHDFEDNRRHIYELSPSDVTEIETALSSAKASCEKLEDIARASFPLPTLGAKLDEFSRQVHEGRGYVVLRGLQPQLYSREDNIILYLGLSGFVGGERRGRQTPDGAKLMHITNVKSAGINVAQPVPVYSNAAQPFHADVVCDVLALYYLQTAQHGGEIFLASSWMVYNELAATRPDIIQTLASNDWPHDTRGCTPSFYNQALLFNHDDKVILNFSRRVLTGAPMTPRSKDIPPLTKAQAEALDAVHFCALKHSVELHPQSGDMFFVNNLAILHSRSAFQDDQQNTRYALRLWLNNPERAWQIPPGLRLEWDRTFAPLEEIVDHYDIDPFENKEKGYQMVTSVASSSSKCFG